MQPTHRSGGPRLVWVAAAAAGLGPLGSMPGFIFVEED